MAQPQRTTGGTMWPVMLEVELVLCDHKPCSLSTSPQGNTTSKDISYILHGVLHVSFYSVKARHLGKM